ncbi:MAG: folylpolyglutamate synthase/dihydrofolate synthase family protein [Bryobacterales bacterium]|nr:bifunctional folylpolyglutamate synthase/dihydrofolate synthase [Bryobacteraceae bacterium]MDW8131803.1 folylpolyglutamate synthase/dihydrofolate synthase family protein [Bryobacterales bacterium]
MTYPDSVRFLYSLANETRTAELGLARITRLLEALGNPHRAAAFVHVAGTNGKGSTCAMIESALRASGRRTGLYTSPHLIEPTERIRIQGRPVSREDFAQAFEQVHAAAERLLREDLIRQHPTYFETVTAMAFLLFARFGVEMAVLEVGLGGRLDATNVVHPLVAVITPVDFDHEKYLGKGLDSIAAEKAGILKRGSAAVFSRQRPEVARVLEQAARAQDITPLWAEQTWRAEEVLLEASGSRFIARGPVRIPIYCPLPGEHQVSNAITAVAVLHWLGVPAAAIQQGIAGVRWPGRLERVASQPQIYLDGAHNPAGARALAAYIERFHKSRRVWLVYGASRDKAVAEIAAILFPLADEVIATAAAHPRSVRPELIRELADHPRLRIAPRVADALRMLEEAGPSDAVFITGSLFLVGEARAMLVPSDPDDAA